MKDKLITKNQSGFSTLEILVAFVLAILGITAVISLVFGSQTVAIDSETDSEATHKAQEMLENARATAKQNFYLVVDVPAVNDDIYQKNLNVTDLGSFTKEVVANVTWTGEHSRNLNVQLTTRITNPIAAAGGDTCSPILSGDWTNPKLLGSADVGKDNGGTDVDVLAQKAFITANAASADKADFYIVDVSNPNLSDLPIFGSINTGPGLAAVHVAGKYAYVANMSTVTQLQVIDISTPSAPVVVSSLKVTPVGDTAVGKSIFYFNKRIYLGVTKSTGTEFYVIDVTDPTSLSASSIKASFEINSQVNSIIIKNNIAYLAVPDDIATPAISEQLKVLDVSQADTGTITALNPFGPNPSTMSGEGLYISKDGNILYLGLGGANPADEPEFFSLDVTSPDSIGTINSKYIPTSKNITVNAITVRSNLAFLWTNDTNLAFQIWDLNNLSSPTPYGALNTQQTATGGFDCDGNFLYTAQRSQKALQIIGPGASAKLTPTVSTTIYNNADGQPVTSVPSGTVVYDEAVITGSAGTPTGTVDFTIYTNKINCTGASTNYNGIPLVSGVAQTPTYTTESNKDISYKAHYNGDSNYNSADGVCEPLTVN